MTNLKQSSRLFQFYPLYFIFKVKYDRYYKVRYVAGGNIVKVDDIDIIDTMVQIVVLE